MVPCSRSTHAYTVTHYHDDYDDDDDDSDLDADIQLPIHTVFNIYVRPEGSRIKQYEKLLSDITSTISRFESVVYRLQTECREFYGNRKKDQEAIYKMIKSEYGPYYNSKEDEKDNEEDMEGEG